MSEHRVLRLKPALGLERRGQHGQNKTDKRDHRANLADSSLNARIGFWGNRRSPPPPILIVPILPWQPRLSIPASKLRTSRVWSLVSLQPPLSPMLVLP